MSERLDHSEQTKLQRPIRYSQPFVPKAAGPKLPNLAERHNASLDKPLLSNQHSKRMERSELLKRESLGMQRVHSSKDQVRVKNNLSRQNLLPENEGYKFRMNPQMEQVKNESSKLLANYSKNKVQRKAH